MDVPTPSARPIAFYHAEHLAHLRSWLSEREHVSEGRMFGVPAWFVSGRVFACVWGPGVALRLPAPQAQSVVASDGFEAFRPFGRAPMSGWLLRPLGSAQDVALSEALVSASYAYVYGLG